MLTEEETLCAVGREWYQQIVEYVLELLLGTYGAVENLWCSGME